MAVIAVDLRAEWLDDEALLLRWFRLLACLSRPSIALAYYFDGLGSLNDRAQTVGQAV